ncbi:AraC family transcriptional regulator [Petralouisia muris]|uniref:AraC family transcriptional regulator n=1 Tax=Petralouisia muris TaxID=3032872 RepID=A0AC61RT85_9FIRM|nr:AraC family transcriptional regulator [Petralouisia muris]TGY95088.1 AraC family transcriptional regulator [Petralouisia muris]
MVQPYYEVFREINELGLQLAYRTSPGGYQPFHWHEELELLFPLNGDATVTIDGITYQLRRRQLLVIESRQVHSTNTYSDRLMILCIHISKPLLERYLPDIELFRLHCIPDEITDAQFPEYLSLCQMAEELTRLYIEEAPAGFLESEGIILQILARLIRYFSVRSAPELSSADMQARQRLRNIITYVGEHFREPISLQEGADLLGLNKEYFCRFFKKHMGLSFLQYINEIRITHIYQELQNTDASITEIMEANGFTNQKLFNKTFKEIYGRTPSAVRKGHREEQEQPLTAAPLPRRLP